MSWMPRELSPWKVVIRATSRKLAGFTRARRPILFPTYDEQVRRRIERYHDDVRYTTLALALQRLETEKTMSTSNAISIRHVRGLSSTRHGKWFG
jgi:hypothetical protein